MAAFASVFHEDGAWILWTGDVWKGRRVIDEGHAAVHKTVFRNSTQRELLEKLTFVGPDAAVVGFCGVLTGDERAPKDVIRSRKVPGRDQAADRVESELRTNTRLQMFKWEIASDAGRGARPYRGNSVLIVERLAEAWVIVAGQAAAVPASK